MKRSIIALWFIAALLVAQSARAQQWSGYPSALKRIDYWRNCFLRDSSYGHNASPSSSTAYIGRNDNVTPNNCDYLPLPKTQESFRMLYRWDFHENIPANATITGAVLEFWYTSSADQKQDLTLMVNQFSSQNWEANDWIIWPAIAAGFNYAAPILAITATQTHDSLVFQGGHRFCQDLQSALPTGLVVLGMKTADDLLWNGEYGTRRYMLAAQGVHAEQGFRLKISYTYPIQVRVENALPGSGGTVRVDGSTHNSPYITTWTSGASHTLQSFEQVLDGKTYSPHPSNPWTDSTHGTGISQNPCTVNPVVPTTYIANYVVSAMTVTVDQKLSGGTGSSTGQIGRWRGGPDFDHYQAPKSFTDFAAPSTETLQGAQDIESDQKYNFWTMNSAQQADVTNHHSFAITEYVNNLTSCFKTTSNGTTVSVDLIDQPGSYGGAISFKDPWLIDYADFSFNNIRRNQGMNAPFKTRTAPFRPDTSTSYGGDVYKGVFLNQSGPLSGWAPPYYSVSSPATSTLGGFSGAFLNWTGNSDEVAFQNSLSRTTGVVFKTANATAKALYKGLHVSSTTSAFADNSQRKFIETQPTGCPVWLHQVYCSANQVWLEHSSDGGATWILGNNGRPLSGTAGGKCPSIAYVAFNSPGTGTHCYIGVVWQEPYLSTYKIKGQVFNQLAGGAVPWPVLPITDLWTEPSDGYAVNANPNLLMASGYAAGYMVVFERKTTSGSYQPGLNWVMAFMEDGGTQELGPFGYPAWQGLISGTNASTTSAQISRDPSFDYTGYVIAGDLVYSTGTVGQIYQKFLYFEWGGGWQDFSFDPVRISYYPGNVNFSPAVTTFPISQFGACWIEYDLLTYCCGDNPSLRYYYGSGAQSASLNWGATNSGFIAWSQLWGSWSNKSIRLDAYHPNVNTIRTLSTTGKYVQLGNSATGDVSPMYVSSFNSQTAPYRISTSATLGPLPKSSSSSLVAGRGFIINNPDAAFIYRLEGVKVDGKNIDFVNVSDTADYGTIDAVNRALVTEPFTIREGSKVLFRERSGFADSASAADALGVSGFVRYKIELVEEGTGKALGTISTAYLTSCGVHGDQARSCMLDATGIGAKTVRAKVTLVSNLISQSARLLQQLPAEIASKVKRIRRPEPQIILTLSYIEGAAAGGDSAVQQLTLQKVDNPISYALDQNYPNPFNPMTQIEYQIPDDGQVSLNVFDALGREVATLADGYHAAGRYTARFDGSRLASGVYLLRMSVRNMAGFQKFSKVSKLLLVK